MKQTFKTISIFVGVMGLAYLATSFILDNKVYAQAALTETVTTTGSASSQKLTAYLTRINTLESKINPAIFNDVVFKSLKDYSKELPDYAKGRQNPFAPISQ